MSERISPGPGWRHIKMGGVGRLVSRVKKEEKWTFRRSAGVGKACGVLELVSNRGVVWEFRLKHGAWIRRSEANVAQEVCGGGGNGQKSGI
jgi:hypothetical protein